MPFRSSCQLHCVFAITAALFSIARAANPTTAPSIARPNVPLHTFAVTDYGAVGDGKSDCTDAVKKAIDACRAAGGGTVVIPPGRFLTGPFSLVSNLNLQLEKDATLLLINDIEKFPMSGGRFVDWITADGCHDIAISGAGTIDGQGQPWWDKYRKRNGVAPDLPHRPNMMVLNRCERVMVEGVTFKHSPMFHLIPRDCSDVTIQDARFEAPDDSPNTDGIDPSGRNFLITRCTFDVGDDCIAVKPQRAGEAGHASCEDFTITDCTFKHGHGLSIGGQTPGGLRRMHVRDCTFEGTEAGIRMKAPRGNGGVVEDLMYENISMTNVKIAIYITSYYPSIPKDVQTDRPQPVTEKTPIWRRIRITNVKAEGGAEAGRILGLPEMPVSDIVLENVHLSADKGLRVVHARKVEFRDSSITPKSGKALLVDDAEISGVTN